MPDELHFWELIELGSRDLEELRRRITNMSEAELVDFYRTYHEHAANLKDKEFTRHLKPARRDSAPPHPHCRPRPGLARPAAPRPRIAVPRGCTWCDTGARPQPRNPS